MLLQLNLHVYYTLHRSVVKRFGSVARSQNTREIYV